VEDENVSDQPNVVGINSKELGDALRYWLDPKKKVPCVVAISGAWGSGKSYWWNHYIPTLEIRTTYISLFGVADVSEMEQRLLVASLGIQDPAAETRITKGFQTLGKLAKIGAEAFKDVPGAGIMGSLEGYLGSVVRDAAYSRLEHAVIAIDDLERRSSTLTLEQVLGFVSRLREVWNASVVLILNESRLSDGDKARLNEFREKVIDCDFRFTVTPSSAAKIGLAVNEWAARGATDFAEQVGLCNIRIFQRVDSVLSRLTTAWESTPQLVLDRLAYSVTGIAWAHFSRDENVPTAEQLLQSNSFDAGMKAADKNRVKEPYETTLSKLRWNTDDMDCLVYAVIASGRVPTEEVNRQLRAYMADHDRNESSARMREAWGVYWSTLGNNADEFVNALSAAYSKHVSFASLSELNGVVNILNDLGKVESAHALIDQQIDWWKQHAISREQLDSGFARTTSDSYLEQQLVQLSPDTTPPLTAREVIEFLSKKSGWNPREEAFLIEMSRSDWIAVLENLKLPDIGRAIGSVRAVYQYLKADKRKKITWEQSPLDEALVELGARSTITKLRVDVLLKD
jgi:hypothetical protein